MRFNLVTNIAVVIATAGVSPASFAATPEIDFYNTIWHGTSNGGTLSFHAGATPDSDYNGETVFTFNLTTAPDIQLRFSYPTISFSSTFTYDGVLVRSWESTFTGAAAMAGGFQINWSDKLLKTNHPFTFDTTVQLSPGNYLTPSLDSSCASLSCMTPGQDIFNLTARGSISPAPEPSVWATLGLGLCLLAGLMRRQRR